MVEMADQVVRKNANVARCGETRFNDQDLGDKTSCRRGRRYLYKKRGDEIAFEGSYKTHQVW